MTGILLKSITQTHVAEAGTPPTAIFQDLGRIPIIEILHLPIIFFPLPSTTTTPILQTESLGEYTYKLLACEVHD